MSCWFIIISLHMYCSFYPECPSSLDNMENAYLSFQTLVKYTSSVKPFLIPRSRPPQPSSPESQSPLSYLPALGVSTCLAFLLPSSPAGVLGVGLRTGPGFGGGGGVGGWTAVGWVVWGVALAEAHLAAAAWPQCQSPGRPRPSGGGPPAPQPGTSGPAQHPAEGLL